MAVDGNWDDPKYTGFRKYFNAYTIRGRSNWAKLWISFYALTFIAYRMIRSKSATSPEATGPQVLPMADSSEPYNSSNDVDLPGQEDTLAFEENLDSSAIHLPPNGPESYSNPKMGGPQTNPQQPCYPPPVFYPCYPPPYYFYPLPNQPNQPPAGNYYPPCPYGHYPNSTPPTKNPESPECSSQNLHKQESNPAGHAPPQCQAQNVYNTPQKECYDISLQSSSPRPDLPNQKCNK